MGRFMQDDKFIRGIMGPVGSGKSVGCCFALHAGLRAFEAAGLPSRWVVVRNTYRELEDTTLRTWNQWFGNLGTWMQRSMTQTIRLKMQHEIMFRALDRPQDVGKLLSLEVSGAWLNEVREIPRAIYDMVQTRIGRYPIRQSYGDDIPPFSLLMDSNPMDDFHWYYRLAEELRPDNAAFYRQPGGLSNDAENTHNLPPEYYANIAKGKDEAWVKVYVDGEYGFAVDGKPVWPGFKDSLHVASEPLTPDDSPVLVGMDFGLTPAAVFMQQTATGQYRVLSELVTEDTAADEFGTLVKAHLGSEYHGCAVSYWGDPAGSQRAQSDKSTPFKVLKAEGIDCRPATVPGKAPNDFDVRQKVVAKALSRLDMATEPVLLVSPACKYLRRALSGGYKYRQLQVAGDERFHSEPEKNIYSHVAEALQYAMIGYGQHTVLLGYDRHQPQDRSAITRRAKRTQSYV
ncbi:MAG: hypothetical protein GY758_01060 [Fuerstiella sp.]|nr:hypothetical protein [Fuerstiella sp.]